MADSSMNDTQTFLPETPVTFVVEEPIVQETRAPIEETVVQDPPSIVKENKIPIPEVSASGATTSNFREDNEDREERGASSHQKHSSKSSRSSHPRQSHHSASLNRDVTSTSSSYTSSRAPRHYESRSHQREYGDRLGIASLTRDFRGTSPSVIENIATHPLLYSSAYEPIKNPRLSARSKKVLRATCDLGIVAPGLRSLLEVCSGVSLG